MIKTIRNILQIPWFFGMIIYIIIMDYIEKRKTRKDEPKRV